LIPPFFNFLEGLDCCVLFIQPAPFSDDQLPVPTPLFFTFPSPRSGFSSFGFGSSTGIPFVNTPYFLPAQLPCLFFFPHSPRFSWTFTPPPAVDPPHFLSLFFRQPGLSLQVCQLLLTPSSPFDFRICLFSQPRIVHPSLIF